MEKIFDFLIEPKLYMSLITIILSAIFYLIFKKVTNAFLEKNKDNKRFSKRRKTYIKLFNNIVKYIILILAVAIILQINGVNITSLVAGVGIISVIAGLSLQDALKDIIMGFNLIIDEYFVAGDVVKINDRELKVIEVGLKNTKFIDTDSNNITIIANRNISEAICVSGQFDIDLPLQYEEKLDRIESVINLILVEILKIDDVKNVEYKGINEFGDSAIIYKIRIYCNPELKYQVKREANKVIKIILDENNISIPYTQIDLHQK